jgi:endo-1,4-beta-xylanase
MAKPGRKESVIKLIKDLQSKGVKVDGIGLQGHFTMTYPGYEEYEAAIADYSKLGVSLMITEMDLTVLPWPSDEVTAEISTRFEMKKEYNPYPDGLPDSAYIAHTNRYLQFFRIFNKYSDHIDRVTLWGVNDAQSWRNDWPIPGRRDYPVLFDRDNKPKAIVDSLLLVVSD